MAHAKRQHYRQSRPAGPAERKGRNAAAMPLGLMAAGGQIQMAVHTRPGAKLSGRRTAGCAQSLAEASSQNPAAGSPNSEVANTRQRRRCGTCAAASCGAGVRFLRLRQQDGPRCRRWCIRSRRSRRRSAPEPRWPSECLTPRPRPSSTRLRWPKSGSCLGGASRWRGRVGEHVHQATDDRPANI